MKTIERHSGTNAPMSARHPNINGGTCEFCGVIDNKSPVGFEQYKLCPHFKDIGDVQCSYCPDNKDPNEVIRMSQMKVADHPDDMHLPPDKRRVIAWCDSFECSERHLKRFKVNV